MASAIHFKKLNCYVNGSFLFQKGVAAANGFLPFLIEHNEVQVRAVVLPALADQLYPDRSSRKDHAGETAEDRLERERIPSSLPIDDFPHCKGKGSRALQDVTRQAHLAGEAP